MAEARIWDKDFEKLLEASYNCYVMVHSAIVPAHQHAVCSKQG